MLAAENRNNNSVQKHIEKVKKATQAKEETVRQQKAREQERDLFSTPESRIKVKKQNEKLLENRNSRVKANPSFGSNTTEQELINNSDLSLGLLKHLNHKRKQFGDISHMQKNLSSKDQSYYSNRSTTSKIDLQSQLLLHNKFQTEWDTIAT